MRISNVLDGIERCPHCGVARPFMARKSDVWFEKERDLEYGHNWAVFQCSSCFFLVLAMGRFGQNSTFEVEQVYPDIARVSDELPETARQFLKQAHETLFAPDGAAMLAGSAVDAMLKDKGYSEGSVYLRIEKAITDGVLTSEMGEWAHSVRLGSNRPRHSDDTIPHVTSEEAKASVEFATALGDFLFVFTERVRRGKANAQASEGDTER